MNSDLEECFFFGVCASRLSHQLTFYPKLKRCLPFLEMLANFQGSHRFFRKIQDFFKTFSRPKVKNSRPKNKKCKKKQCYVPFCCKHTNFVAFAPAIRKTCTERRAHACLLVTALKRFARLIARSNEQTVRSTDHAKNIRSFRTRFAGRSLTDTATSTLLSLSAQRVR